MKFFKIHDFFKRALFYAKKSYVKSHFLKITPCWRDVAKSDQLWNFRGLAKFRSDLAKSLYLQKLRILAKSIQLRAAKNLASAEVIWPN